MFLDAVPEQNRGLRSSEECPTESAGRCPHEKPLFAWPRPVVDFAGYEPANIHARNEWPGADLGPAQ
jgi:hypothetical protein